MHVALIIMLLVNAASYCIARLLVGKVTTGVKINPYYHYRGSSPTVVYVICGCQGRTREDYTLSELARAYEGRTTAVYTVEYDNWGIGNLERAAQEIACHAKRKKASSVVFISASIGCKLAATTAYMLQNEYETKIFAMSPCWGKNFLAPQTKKATAFLPAGYTIAHVLGWLLRLPIIKSNGQPYSLQLLLDQFKICAEEDDCMPPQQCSTAVVVCWKDTVVSPIAVERAALDHEHEVLNLPEAPHFGTGGVWIDHIGEQWKQLKTFFSKTLFKPG